MLTFFRRVRKSLIESGAVRKYIFYAIGEILLVMVGILLALQVNNWNEKRKEFNEEKRLLVSFHDELQANRTSIEKRILWHNDIRSALNTLLDNSASPQLSIGKNTVDTLVGTICWYNNSSTFEMSANDAIITSGKLSIINNEYLRQKITEWNRDVLYVQQVEKQDYDAFNSYWMPYLQKHVYLPQISNAITTQPGTRIENYASKVTLRPNLKDHSVLLLDENFQNLLVRRLWVMDDILFSYEQIKPKLEILIDIVATEVD